MSGRGFIRTRWDFWRLEHRAFEIWCGTWLGRSSSRWQSWKHWRSGSYCWESDWSKHDLFCYRTVYRLPVTPLYGTSDEIGQSLPRRLEDFAIWWCQQGQEASFCFEICLQSCATHGMSRKDGFLWRLSCQWASRWLLACHFAGQWWMNKENHRLRWKFRRSCRKLAMSPHRWWWFRREWSCCSSWLQWTHQQHTAFQWDQSLGSSCRWDHSTQSDHRRESCSSFQGWQQQRC